MKKDWMIVLMIVFSFAFIGNVVAMSEPITILGDEGKNFRFYIREPDTNILLYFESEDFDESEKFSKTFFTLREPNPKYQIKIFSGNNMIIDETFEGYGISNSLTIDCVGSDCSISAGTPENTEEGTVVDETVPDENASNDETSIEEITNENSAVNTEEENSPNTETELTEDEPSEFPFTGMSIFNSEDGSTNWGYLIGGIFSFLLMVFIIVMMMHRARYAKTKITEDNPVNENTKKDLDPEEVELKELEEKIKKREGEIKRIKEKRMRHQKLIEAKTKLQKEEKEISQLVGDDNRIKEAKRKLQVREQILKNLKKGINENHD